MAQLKRHREKTWSRLGHGGVTAAAATKADPGGPLLWPASTAPSRRPPRRPDLLHQRRRVQVAAALDSNLA